MSSSYRQVLRSSTNDPAQPSSNQSLAKSPSSSTGSHAHVDHSDSSENARTPPIPPRSAFMCFTDAKKGEIMRKNGITEENDRVLTILAEEWKNLSDKDRAYWDEESRNDKVRYARAKAIYQGPTLIPKRRAKKHPLAPKRPMSAFLKFSQNRRQRVKLENPELKNTDVSVLLGAMWRNASEKEKAPFQEQELRERVIYKENIKKFKEDLTRVDAATRTSHQTVQGYPSVHYPEEYNIRHRPPYTTPIPPPPTNFESLHVDSFEEPVISNNHGRPSHFRPRYSTYSAPPPYREPYLHPTETAALPHQDYHDEPLPIMPSRARMPSPQSDDFDPMSDHYGGNRSNYFHDNMNTGYYSRYP